MQGFLRVKVNLAELFMLCMPILPITAYTVTM